MRFVFERENNKFKPVRDIATKIVGEVLLIWDRARIPVRSKKYCIDLVVALISDYETLKKYVPRSRLDTPSGKQQISTFKTKLESLFDISHTDTFNLLKHSSNEEWEVDWMFLLNQRKFPQEGTMQGIDRILAVNEKNRKKKQQQRESYKKKEMVRRCENRTISQLDLSLTEEESIDEDDGNCYQQSTGRKRKRSTVTLQIPTKDLLKKVSTVSDGAHISERQQLVLISSAIKAGGGNLDDITLSKTSCHSARKKNRSEEAHSILENWVRPEFASLHWDTKLFELVTGKKEDRIAISLGPSPHKLLGIPSIASSTGANQMIAVSSVVDKWSLEPNVVAVTYDTTASNSGEHNGAAILIEKRFGRALLHLECRHHVSELHVKATEQVVCGKNNSPTVKLFVRFKQQFDSLDKDEENLVTYEWPADNDFLYQQALKVKQWAIDCLQKKTFPREDYRELVELILFYLGGHVERGFFIRRPGADHHARFMSKAIYYLKMCILSNSFELNEKEKRQVTRMAIYIALFYGKCFLESSLTASAPANDLEFFHLMKQYSAIDKEAASESIKSIKRHLSYLSQELVVFALFDRNVSTAEKTMMGQKLFSTERPSSFLPYKPKPPVIAFRDGEKPILSSFIGEKSWLLFSLLKLHGSQEWLNIPAEH